MRRLSLALVLCALLAGCGGDDSGGGVPTPSPSATPSPTPSPTPTPTPTLSTGELKPVANATFLSATMEMMSTGQPLIDPNGQASPGTTSNRTILIDTPRFAAGYDPATGYRMSDAVNKANFGLAELVSDTTNQEIDPCLLFTKVNGSIEDYLKIYKHEISTTGYLGTGTFKPMYGGTGIWQHAVSNLDARHLRFNYFAYGPATLASAMPRSGIVKFSLLGFGSYAADSDFRFVSQSDTITVDFGTGAVIGMVNGSGRSLFNGNIGGVFGTSVRGTISGNTVSGPTESGVAIATGQFHLLFIGPNADELIITYVGQDGTGTYAGSAVGVRNPYVT